MHVLGVKRYSKFDHEFTKHSILSKSNLLCQLCDKRFFHKKDLERHMKSTHFNRFYTCNDCSKNFVHEYLYKKHRNSSCGNVKDTYFECISDGCSRKFKEKRFMNEHYKRDHKGRMEMYCMNCQKGFRHRSTYYRHKNYMYKITTLSIIFHASQIFSGGKEYLKNKWILFSSLELNE